MSWRSCANRLRMVLQEDNFAGVMNLNAFTALAAWVVTLRDSGSAR
jgi:hypothetical protein